MLAFFAWLLGRSWGSALLRGGPWPVLMCHLMFVLFFYVPGNNQIFQTAETCVAFFLVLAAWATVAVLDRIEADTQAAAS